MEENKNEYIRNIQYSFSGDEISFSDIVKSWDGNIDYEKMDKILRKPQVGALYAIKSHFTVCNDAVTVVMPTGTGKTETMLAYIVSEKIEKTLVIVPKILLKNQTYEKFKTLGLIKKSKILKDEAYLPNVCMLKKIPNKEELNNLVKNTNVLVVTMGIISKMDEESIDIIKDYFSTVIIDEAHHIAAKTWSSFKSKIKELKIIQFTATPFRNDNKKIDGKIIYNYPLKKAQEDGYFKKIKFIPVIEYEKSKYDYTVAQRAIEVLEKDIKDGYDHIMLVRANTQEKAARLYNEIYNNYYTKYNPVLITSEKSKKNNQKSLDKLKSLESRIVVCVDMFGEGIDLPNLKIAAIHDKYKSLPITLQFVGRFTRVSNGKIGNASLIANIMDDDVNEEIKNLYSLDSNWDYIISDLSKTAIEKEVTFQEFMRGFDIEQLREISIKQLVPKVSMVAYITNIEEWKLENWTKIFNEEMSVLSVNEEKNTFVVIEAIESSIPWTSNRVITNKNLELHVVYWNKEKNTVFINTSNKLTSKMIAEKIFKTDKKISGDKVFRVLSGINRLMMGSVGLRTAVNGPIRYRMFAGIDIAPAISDTVSGNSTKANIFGTGYNGNGKVSIGCSYKGTIWSKWVETIDYWKKWCDDLINKINDDTIDTKEILESALTPVPVKERPKKVPIAIEWPDELIIDDYDKYSIKYGVNECELDETDFKPKNIEEVEENIKISINSLEFELIINEKGYKFINNSGKKIELLKNGKAIERIEKYFEENPPRIYFEDQSSIEGNLYIEIKKDQSNCFKESRIIKEDWENTDISIESQKKEKIENSIQYHMIQKLKSSGDYDIIFNDDGPGEISDIIALKETEKDVIFELYHCKYSKEPIPGGRIGDLYEVCGQCQKSVKWVANISNTFQQILNRESKAKLKGYTRIELGNIEKIYKYNNMIKVKKVKAKIFIVQPGVDSKQITENMKYLLSCTQSYLVETYSIPLFMICS